VQFQESQKLRAMAETKFREMQDEYFRRRWPNAQAWLSAYNSTAQQDACLAAKADCPGSGQWLLDDDRFKKWFHPTFCSTPLLWLNGIPGAGKTVLVSTVIEAIQALSNKNPADKQVRLAYFYCKQGDASRNNFVSVAKGLLSHLVKGNSDLILHIYEQGNLQSGEAILLDRSMTKALLDVAVVDSQKITYVIIDGLDECEPDERKEICSWFINRVNQLGKGDFGVLRCLFASQEDRYTKRDLGAVPSIKMFPINTRDDIKRYVMFWEKKIEDKHGKLDPSGAASSLADLILSATQGDQYSLRSLIL